MSSLMNVPWLQLSSIAHIENSFFDFECFYLSNSFPIFPYLKTGSNVYLLVLESLFVETNKVSLFGAKYSRMGQVKHVEDNL